MKIYIFVVGKVKRKSWVDVHGKRREELS